MMTAKRLLAFGIILVALLGISNAAVPARAQSAKPFNVTLDSLGYKGDVLIQGNRGAQAFLIPLLSDWVVTQDVRVTVVYTASSVLNEQQSTVTISAAGN